MTPIFQTLLGISQALAVAGVPTLSPHWLAECEHFYEHPSARVLVEMVGRGGDKSRTSVVMAIAEVLAGDFSIAPGERHYFTHVSENRDEAAKTLGVLEQYLKILGVPHTRSGDTIELTQLPRGFKVLSSRVGAVSGWRCIGWTGDECAKWNNEGVDPSSEVIASMRAMTVTHPNARGRMFSSPLATLGHFYETWALGDTDDQVVGHAPSWVANPSITEAQTRKLEPRENFWKREYAAQPSGNLNDTFTPELVDRAFVASPGDIDPVGPLLMILDPSSGKKDTWAFCLAGWYRRRWADRERYLWEKVWDDARGKHIERPVRHPTGHFVMNPDYQGDAPFFGISHVDGYEGAFHQAISAESIVSSLASSCVGWGVSRVLSDQREAYLLESAFARHGMRFQSIPWNNVNKGEGVAWILRLMREGRLKIQPHEKLRRELLTFRERIMPSGAIAYEGRNSDDYVALLLTSALGDIGGYFAGSPTQRGGGRTDFGPEDFKRAV